ncbi:MAG: Flp pilus assembly protein CpaB [Pseudomonadota bacterium]
MRLVFGLVLVVGLGLAGFAVYMAQEYIGANRAALERERAARQAMVPLADAFIVNRTIKYGERLTRQDIAQVQFPVNAMPQGVFKTVEEIFPGSDDEFRTVLRTMDAREALTSAKVTEPGKVAGVTSMLVQGERAFTIRVDVTSGVSGFLRPGDRVDVYWTGRTNIGEITKLIDGNVRLIAIDQSSNSEVRENRVARTVTVAVSPQQVAAFAQAQATGRLTLSLRGATDEIASGPVEINQNDLLGNQETVVEEEEVCTIRTRRGAEIVVVPIECAN